MEIQEKITFKRIFLILSGILVVLPFITAFSEQLTILIQKTPVYLFIQSYIVPFEIRIVALILNLIGIKTGVGMNSLTVSGQPLEFTWNCLGWQSLLFLIVTLITGLQGNYTRVSKIEVVGIGILGTFWINILRMTFVSILAGYFPSIFAVVFHNYFASIVTTVWFLIFWWFSYKYVLDPTTY